VGRAGRDAGARLTTPAAWSAAASILRVPTESWADRASERLAAAGYRRGGARRAVLELLGAQECALTVQEIEDALRASERRVGRASVYRVLDELEGLGLAARVEVGQGIARYEAVAEHHHHHIVCDRCGDVLPFSDDELEQVIGRVAGRVPFDVSAHEVTLHGACDACR
jgi:Fur family transcriptional regulator, ferric uptake regulator